MSTQSDAPFLWRTPPYCNTVECYVHGTGGSPANEHHVEGCAMYDTVASSVHRFSDAIDALIRVFVAGVDAAVEADASQRLLALALTRPGWRRWLLRARWAWRTRRRG